MESKVISEINELFEVLNERVKGYEKAIEIVNTPEYKALFRQNMEQSARFENSLRAYSSKTPEETGIRIKGELGRFWMEIKSAVVADDEEAVLDACIQGESAAIDKYNQILDDEDLPFKLRTIVSEQLSDIRAAHGDLVRLKAIK